MPAAEKPITALLQDAAGDIAGIVRNEARLAQAEVKENLRDAMGGVIKLVIGAAVMIPAVTMLLLSLAWLLAENGVFPLWGSALAVAVLGGIVGAVLLNVGRKALDPGAIAPTRTMDNLSRDVRAVKEATR